MIRLTRLFPVLIIISAIMGGCSSRPDEVISHRKMVDLMVDIHKGEAFAEANSQMFRADSTKMVLRQSILRKHGVTAEQFDSSLMWYGRHTDELTELYGEVIDRLESDMNSINVAHASTSFAGDSINAWTESNFYVLSDASPSHILKFLLPSDENWQPGDSYTWQFKTLNQHDNGVMALYMDYDDGSTEMITSDFNHDGWQRLTITADSLRNPVNVYGFTTFEIKPSESLYLDSVSLVRKRLSKEQYRYRFRQRTFRYGSKQSR